MQPDTANQSRLKNIALFSYDDQDALATLRLLGPAKMAGWNILRGYDFDDGKVHIERVDAADMIFIQRDFCRDYDTYAKIKSLLAIQRKPLLIDLDDNLFEIPPDHPDRLVGYYADALLPIYQVVKEADLVTVATEPLRDYLLPFNPTIHIVPNYLDDSIWEVAPRVPKIDENATITIGYMGGWTHRPDLQMVVPVLKGLLDKYPGRIQYHFWGIDAPVELERYSQVDWYPLLFTRYDEFAKAFKEIDADILIAPLCDNSFNACKSCIKFLEYGAAGIPAIYSRVRPYIDTVEHGKDGLLAATDEEWMTGLCRLIESPSLRVELMKNAQEKIRKDWLLSANIARRIQIYEEAIANFRPKVWETTPSSRMEQTLSILNYEEAVRKDKQVKSLKAQGVEKDEHIFYLDHNLKMRDENIRQLEEEILSYVTSRSWRLTRPFREFIRFLKRLIHV
jgi:processive 1,2-diacylglycerol beta-glucosyltransferase